MVAAKTKRLNREDWIRGALELLSTSGIEKVKIVPLAEKLGVTSGSFYWHFTNRRQLLLSCFQLGRKLAVPGNTVFKLLRKHGAKE